MKKVADMFVVHRLLVQMEYCRYGGISFDACMAEARKRFNREVREEALTKPLPAK